MKAGDKHVPLDVLYADERVEKGPLVCIQVYFDGTRTGETCDRKHRDPDERWNVGIVDMATGKLLDPAPGRRRRRRARRRRRRRRQPREEAAAREAAREEVALSPR